MTATLLSLPLPAPKKEASSQDHKHWGQLQGEAVPRCVSARRLANTKALLY